MAENPTTITVTAWRAGTHWVAPDFTLLIDGKEVGVASADTYSAMDYSFTVDLDPDQAHTVQVRYQSDTSTRDLFVSGIQIGEFTMKSTDLGVTYDKGAIDGRDVVSGQEALYWNGALNFEIPAGSIDLPQADDDNLVSIMVTASGTSTDGEPPRFNLLLDGEVIGQGSVSSGSPTDYVFKVEVPAGQEHEVQVQYLNDSSSRDFYIHSVTIDGQEIKSTDPNVTYDKGALDGRDTVAGQEAMYWNGTMVFGAPASMFPESIEITVTARRTGSDPTPPHLKLMLDGEVIGEADVTTTTDSTYLFTAKVAPEDVERVQVQYTNDASGRDLFVTGVAFNGTDYFSTGSNVVYDKGALDGRDTTAGQEAMYWNGTMVFAIKADGSSDPAEPTGTDTSTDDSYDLVVTAWRTGTNARPPIMKVFMDDELVGSVSVSATSATDYAFTITGDPNEAHKIQIIYDNDDYDRDLHVTGITIDDQFIASTSSYASYDKGAVDGIYVVSGTEDLYWGGGLTFGLPESVFNGSATVETPSETDAGGDLKTVDITVNASGTASSGTTPYFKVMVDGRVVGEANASASDSKAYTFRADVDPSEAHEVQIVFDSDGQGGNLSVDSIVVNGRTVDSTASNVTYDKGELDGEDVVAGQASLSSTGTLGFDIPAGTFSDTATPQAPMETAYYVSAVGNDNWSGTLAEPNADGTDGPFASLEKAQAAMRTSDIETTYVRQGTYHLAETLTLTSQDSGVAFKAYPSETVVLSGGEVVTGFTDEGNGVYSAKLDEATDLDLSIGGERQRLAEKGEWDEDDVTAGWYFADAAAAGASSTSLRYQGDDVSLSDLAPGTRIQVMNYDRLEDAIVEIKSIDTETKTITFETSAGFALEEGTTFRLVDNAGYVDQETEFAWRESDGRLVFKPASPQTLEEDGVEVARLDTLIYLNEAKNVTIEGFTFTNTKSGGEALLLKDADNNQISNNAFHSVGTGIALTEGSSNNVVSGNDLEQLAEHGILLTYGSDANHITANDISQIGMVTKHAGGIYAYGVNDNIISHNEISDSSRYGISIKTWDESTTSSNNIIEYNKIANTMLETADGGAIETLGRLGMDSGNIIRGNWIDGAEGLATSASDKWIEGQKGFGIYLDDMSGGTTVEGNFIMNTSWASIMIHGGDNNSVTNNIGILDDNKEDFIWIAAANPSHGEKAVPVNNTVTGNIIYGELPLDDYIQLEAAGTFTINNNLVYDAPTYGLDDVTGNPQFANRLAGDYSLQDASPAKVMGFEDLQWELMGNIQGLDA
ncbi:Ca-dependent carbohydrate-binding module xylan-binding [Azospirillum oryzae]|uniref:Ca-dependent carbohydrate-binding module xylan-binding n=1 Tax=Azospirillum oryzae TaxID=286727 RepID=A0A1X7HKL7_9PROT|nr:carbohydrate-binding domain-containing protein [Azospirillum oryzae]SMF88438.1 Ca-dependent carbohydrate-binding module xylan-binding [Azospirillum oryzae]